GKDGAPAVYYAASNSGSLELYRGLFDPEKPNGSPQMLGHTRLTFDAEGAFDAEELITAIPYGDSELVAYVNNRPRFGTPGVGQLVTRLLEGEESPFVGHDAGLYFTDLALGAFGPTGDRGGVLAWVAEGEQGGSTQFQRI